MPASQSDLEKTIQRTVTDEIFRGLGFDQRGIVRRLFGPLLAPAAKRFAKLAAEFDQEIEQHGISDTTGKFLPRFVQEMTVCGQENVPPEGPLLIVSNHPGTLDGFVIISQLPRDDIKVIISGVPFVRALSAASRHLIYTPSETPQRIKLVRSAIRHLKEGGSLLLFPSGRLDQDPATLPGARQALELWSTSLELFIRRAPESQVLPTIVSGVLVPRFMRNPLTGLRKEFWHKQRIAEYIQVTQMMFFSKQTKLSPKVSFGQPIPGDKLVGCGGEEDIMGNIIERTRQLLDVHISDPDCIQKERIEP